MRQHAVRFSENVIVVLATISILGALLAGHYLDRKLIGYAIAVYAASYAVRSLGAEVTVTKTFLVRKNLFGESRIAWDEMELVEITGENFWFVFHGRDKRISMPGPMTSIESFFRQEDEDEYEDEAAGLLLGLADEHGVLIAGNWLAPFKLSKC